MGISKEIFPGKKILPKIAGYGLAAITFFGTVAWVPETTVLKPVEAVGQATSPLETPTPIPTVRPGKPTPDIDPFIVGNIRSSIPLQNFRNGLSEDIDASITYFGENGYAGVVMSEEGVKLRHLPDVNSKSVSFVEWLRYGELVPFQGWVDFRKNHQLLARWVLIGNKARPDQKGKPGARWECENGWPRSYGNCFSAAYYLGMELISSDSIVPPSADQVISYPWTTKPISSAYDTNRIAPSQLKEGIQQDQLYGNMAQGYPNSRLR